MWEEQLAAQKQAGGEAFRPFLMSLPPPSAPQPGRLPSYSPEARTQY